MLALEPGASGPALRMLGARLERPRAILLQSAHWESTDLLVGSGARPDTWHDFYGFAPELYELQYPAAGDPQLATEISARLRSSGLDNQLDAQRPRDHGAWVPGALMYPAADIPLLQISLPTRRGAAFQLRVGQALASLRAEGVLLIGSGSITHNLGLLDWHAGPGQIAPWAQSFRDWVVARLTAGDTQALLDYRAQAPFAVRSHPTEEHLLPLFFAMGAGGTVTLEHSGFSLGALGMDIYSFA
jgi:4,5-DOPA dioxygenase extradiol